VYIQHFKSSIQCECRRPTRFGSFSLDHFSV